MSKRYWPEIVLFEKNIRLVLKEGSFSYAFYAASEHPFKGVMTSLPKPGGGEFGKFYSLPALNDPRIGMLPQLVLPIYFISI